ncbi:hypothetical protein DCS_02576 [Drechmeria coniospora]|uniref:Uncharacterized protein n=1 Tax=Drechmeria coniospora TaxID=98403 RepID=A0A151GWG2_DRECN|nr:hypothetical protein DCS_02576 [Drechmeria coniospora]KYK61434.1 hypothetical protein DCS_02576 [Drechmeria coniospora]
MIATTPIRSSTRSRTLPHPPAGVRAAVPHMGSRHTMLARTRTHRTACRTTSQASKAAADQPRVPVHFRPCFPIPVPAPPEAQNRKISPIGAFCLPGGAYESSAPTMRGARVAAGEESVAAPRLALTSLATTNYTLYSTCTVQGSAGSTCTVCTYSIE